MRGHSGKKIFLTYALLFAVMLSSCNSGENISSASEADTAPDTTASVTVFSDTDNTEVSESETPAETVPETVSETDAAGVSGASGTEMPITEISSGQNVSTADTSETTVSDIGRAFFRFGN